MRKHAFLSCLLVACVSAPVAAQEVQHRKAEKAEKAEKTEAAEKPSAAETARLIEQLGDTSYEVRRDAEEALRRQGKSALGALKKAADAHTDSEVRWRAERLARQIESGDGDAGGLRARRPGSRPKALPPVQWARPGLPPDLNGLFDSLFGQLERDFDIDIPRRRFFRDDFFKDLDAQMDAMRQQMRGMDALGRGSMGQSMRMQMGPDGIVVEVEEKDVDGKVETKTYEAPDLESFRTKYPEIAGRLLAPRGRGLAPRLPGLQLRERDQQLPPTEPSDTGPRLGVIVKDEISSDLREFLGLQPGTGLMIERVLPDTLAERLGLRAGDIVLKIDDDAIGSPGDVRAALRKAGDKPRVRINRRGVERTLE